MPAPVAAAAAAPAVISAVGGIMSQIMQNESVSGANATTRKIAKENRDWMQEMWNLQNDYNSPKNQRARFEEAGINPYMALGNFTSGEAQGIGNPDSPQMMANDYSNMANSLQTATGQLQNARLIEAQAQKEYNEAQSVGIDNSTKYLRDLATLFKLRSENAHNEALVKEIDTNINRTNALLQYEQRNLDTMANRNQAEADDMYELKRLHKLQADAQDYDLKFIKPQELRALNTSIEEAVSRIGLNKVNASMLDWTTKKVILEAYGQSLSNTQFSKLYPYVRDELRTQIGLNIFNQKGTKLGVLGHWAGTRNFTSQKDNYVPFYEEDYDWLNNRDR